MADDPTKRGAADRRRVSQQPHEQAYQKRKAKQSGEKSSSSGSKRSTDSGRGSTGGRSASRS